MVITTSKITGTTYSYEDAHKFAEELLTLYEKWEKILADNDGSNSLHSLHLTNTAQAEFADLTDMAQQAGWESIEAVKQFLAKNV